MPSYCYAQTTIKPRTSAQEKQNSEYVVILSMLFAMKSRIRITLSIYRAEPKRNSSVR